MCSRSRIVVASAVVLLIVVEPVAAGIIYDLAADWSDVTNPNGVWSYNKGPGDPILVHQDAWYTGQPAWADASVPTHGHIPAWAKSAEGGLAFVGGDLPVGRVGVHTNDTASGGSTNAGVTWTSPIDGTIVLSGGIWLADKVSTNRPQAWRLLDQSGNELCSGHLNRYDSYTSSNPLLIEETLPVSIGDVITLEVFKEPNASFGTWVGVDLSLDATSSVPEPTTLAIWSALGGLGLIAARRRRKVA